MKNESYKKSTISGIFWKLSERLLAQLVSMIVSIALARLLTPDDYSIVGIVTIFFTFANVFISSGLNTALIQKKDSDIDDFSTVLYTSILISLFLYFALFVAAPFISGIYQQDLLIPIFRVMGLVLIVNAIKSVVCAYISNTLQFRKFFFATLGGTLLSGFVGIAMARQGYGPWALVAQQMTNSVVDTIILVLSTRIRFVLRFSFDKLKKLFGYGWKIFVAQIISVIYDEINPLVIGLKFEPKDLSFYTKGRSFPNLLNHSISDTLSAVLFPVMSKMQDDKKALLEYTRKYMRMSSFVIFPLMIGFMAVSDNFVRVILTEKWIPASIYIKIFCFTYMFNILNNGNLQVIRAIGRSDLILKLEIIKKFSYFVVILTFILTSNRPEMLAIATIINSCIAIIVNTYPNRKLINYGYRKQFSDIVFNLLISAVMGVCVYLMNYINISKLPLMVFQIILGATIYVLLNLVFKNSTFKLLIDTVKSTVKRG